MRWGEINQTRARGVKLEMGQRFPMNTSAITRHRRIAVFNHHIRLPIAQSNVRSPTRKHHWDWEPFSRFLVILGLSTRKTSIAIDLISQTRVTDVTVKMSKLVEKLGTHSSSRHQTLTSDTDIRHWQTSHDRSVWRKSTVLSCLNCDPINVWFSSRTKCWLLSMDARLVSVSRL